jgi:hypothetical protein
VRRRGIAYYGGLGVDFDHDGEGDVCDLEVLRATGVYTQIPGSNALANRPCGVAATSAAYASTKRTSRIG